MLDVAFDSVVTMDDDGVVLAVNRAAERLFGYRAAEMVGREVAELIIPRVAARRAPRRARALPAHGARAGRRPRVELTAMRADGTEFPVELVVTRPEHPRRAGLLRLPARPDRALRRRGRAAPAGRRAGGAAAGGDRGRGRARADAAVRAGVGGGRAAAARRRPRTCSASTPTARGGEIVGGWALRPEHVLPAGTRMPLDGDTAVDARVANRAGGAHGLLRGRRGRAGGDDARVRRAGRGRRADLPRRVAVGRGDRLVDGPRAVPAGRRAADRLLRRARRPGAGQRPGARGARGVARPHRGRRATPSAGGWSATCTTARSSGSCRSR